MATAGNFDPTSADYTKPPYDKRFKIDKENYDNIFRYMKKVIKHIDNYEDNPMERAKKIKEKVDKIQGITYGSGIDRMNPHRRIWLRAVTFAMKTESDKILPGASMPNHKMFFHQFKTYFIPYLREQIPVDNETIPKPPFARYPALRKLEPELHHFAELPMTPVSQPRTPATSASNSSASSSLFSRLSGSRSSTRSVSNQSVAASPSSTPSVGKRIKKAMTPKPKRKTLDERLASVQLQEEEESGAWFESNPDPTRPRVLRHLDNNITNRTHSLLEYYPKGMVVFIKNHPEYDKLMSTVYDRYKAPDGDIRFIVHIGAKKSYVNVSHQDCDYKLPPLGETLTGRQWAQSAMQVEDVESLEDTYVTVKEPDFMGIVGYVLNVYKNRQSGDVRLLLFIDNPRAYLDVSAQDCEYSSTSDSLVDLS